jgi:hypothetical protein
MLLALNVLEKVKHVPAHEVACATPVAAGVKVFVVHLAGSNCLPALFLSTHAAQFSSRAKAWALRIQEMFDSFLYLIMASQNF